MNVYYNEFDPNAAAWLRNLGSSEQILQGVVDERSIKEIRGSDLAGINRAHFFAGIGGWDHALKLAGWPEDREVWTGSCPCQPFSAAGKHKGEADSRHLWPDFLRLIAECLPATVFGEQVASKDGRKWLTGIRTDLEALGYRVAGADLCAASVGAPHIRQRLYWVADRGMAEDADGVGRGRGRDGDSARNDGEVQAPRLRPTGGVGNGNGNGRNGQPSECRGDIGDREEARRNEGVSGLTNPCAPSGLEYGNGERFDSPRASGSVGEDVKQFSDAIRLGDSQGDRLTRQQTSRPGRSGSSHDGAIDGMERGESDGRNERRTESGGRGTLSGRRENSWSDSRIVLCTDGKARRTGARVFPLAHGIPRGMGGGRSPFGILGRSASRARIGMLKGSGNAIVPELAAKFIMAYMDTFLQEKSK